MRNIISILGKAKPKKVSPIVTERNSALIAENPDFALLRRKLLTLGGDEVVLRSPDPELPLLLARGDLFKHYKAELVEGHENSCHENSGRLWLEDREGLRICTGYALSDDGLWRQHSWAIRLFQNQLLETTTLRKGYFGVVLLDDEAELFCRSNELLE